MRTVHNGIAAEEAVMQQIAAWGKPAYLIVPSGFHRLDEPVLHAHQLETGAAIVPLTI